MTTYRYRLTVAFVGLAMIGSNSIRTSGQLAQPSALLSAVQSAQPEDDDFGALAAAALDGTAEDRARLAVILRRGTEAQRTAALVALAYSGGDDAIATLESYRHPTNDDVRRALLCFALAGRGTGADRAALVRALRGAPIGDEWPPIEVAALSLGVLRATEATSALERVAATDDGTSAADAAGEALRWLRQGPWRVELPADASDDDAVIRAAFSNGIPRTADAPAFYEAARGGAWTFEGSVWRFRRGPRAAGTPALDFTVHRNARGTRALLSVGVSFGPKNGSGYDYLLVRDGGRWRVTGVMFTWVS
jgi:hypothetical protein